MKDLFFKRSAVHNLLISKCRTKFSKNEISEGLVIPKDILMKCDILPWEQIIVTKINGNNWINRIKTFVIEGEIGGKVEARGSIAKFLNQGDLTCLISNTMLNEKELKSYINNKLPIFDLGFDPKTNKNNDVSRLDIEHRSEKLRDVKKYAALVKGRQKIRRFFLSSLVIGLKINKTHPDCLQGSAELPKNIMDNAGLERYQSVAVYNSSKGGIADTYAVPMPPKVVMTTGAMAKFAKKGEMVNIATFTVSDKKITPKIVFTDGSDIIKK